MKRGKTILISQINRDEPIYTFRLTNEVALRWTSLSIVLFIVAAAGISTFYTTVHGQSWTLDAGDRSINQAWQTIIVLLYFLGVPIGTFIIHELIHGLAFAVFGGKPRYGVGIKFFMLYLYATSSNYLFSRNAFLTISLAPLIVIDAIALLLLAIFPQAPWLGWIVVFNTAGAIGDIWMATLLLRCPSSIAVEDRKAGMAIYAPPNLNPRSLLFQKRREKIKSRLWSLLDVIVSVVAALIVVSFVLPLLFDILQVPSFAIGTDSWWIVRWENNAQGFNLALDLFPLLAIAAVLILLTILLRLAIARSRI
jgi:hypothetical protein